jgi:hypothetical protein
MNGIHVDGVEMGHNMETHLLSFLEELHAGLTGIVVRVILVVTVGAPVWKM